VNISVLFINEPPLYPFLTINYQFQMTRDREKL